MKINDIKENHGHPGQLYRFAMVDESGQMHRSKPMPAEECKVWLHKAKHMHNPEYMTIYPAHDVDQKLTIDEVMMQHPNMAHDLAEDGPLQIKQGTTANLTNQQGQTVMTAVDQNAASQIKALADQGKISVGGQAPGGSNNNVSASGSSGGSSGGNQSRQYGPMEEGFFGTTEEELAKEKSPAGDYYRKLAALKTDPRWAGKQELVQHRIDDLLNRINNDQGVPQPGQGQPMGPETDPAKFQQKNPSFHEGKHKDTIAQGGGDVGGDATDNFIKQVKDRAYEKANRNGADSGQRSPVAQNKKLKETDELYKWLTIAGIK